LIYTRHLPKIGYPCPCFRATIVAPFCWYCPMDLPPPCWRGRIWSRSRRVGMNLPEHRCNS
jgi:hypothetical protein